MSLSRSPSPRRGGGWSSPGLTNNYDNVSGQSSPRKNYGDLQMNGSARSSHGVTWASAQAKTQDVNGYPSFSTRNNGFFARHARKLSTSLPTFSSGARNFSDKEKLGRGRWLPPGGGSPTQLLAHFGRMLWRFRLRVGIVLGLLVAFLLFYTTRTLVASSFINFWLTGFLALHRAYRRASVFGGGSKFVIILAANQGGGVMEWKGPREWAIERDSVRNKKKYAKKWGYDLEIVDMSTKKRYAHEWRESWEKVDTIRNCMRKYPNAEW